MNIHIVAVGRARAGPEAALYQHYTGRLTQWPITLSEQELKRRAAPNPSRCQRRKPKSRYR